MANEAEKFLGQASLPKLIELIKKSGTYKGSGSDSVKLEYTFTEEDFESLMSGEELPIEFTTEQQAEFETALTAFADGKNVYARIILGEIAVVDLPLNVAFEGEAFQSDTLITLDHDPVPMHILLDSDGGYIHQAEMGGDSESSESGESDIFWVDVSVSGSNYTVPQGTFYNIISALQNNKMVRARVGDPSVSIVLFDLKEASPSAVVFGFEQFAVPFGTRVYVVLRASIDINDIVSITQDIIPVTPTL